MIGGYIVDQVLRFKFSTTMSAEGIPLAKKIAKKTIDSLKKL